MIPFHRDLPPRGGGWREDFHGCFGAQPPSSAVVSALALPVPVTHTRMHTHRVQPHCFSVCSGVKFILLRVSEDTVAALIIRNWGDFLSTLDFFCCSKSTEEQYVSFLFKLTKWLVDVGIYLLCLQVWHECTSTHVTFYFKYSYFDTMSVCLQTLSFSGRFLSKGVFTFYVAASVWQQLKVIRMSRQLWVTDKVTWQISLSFGSTIQVDMHYLFFG